MIYSYIFVSVVTVSFMSTGVFNSNCKFIYSLDDVVSNSSVEEWDSANSINSIDGILLNKTFVKKHLKESTNQKEVECNDALDQEYENVSDEEGMQFGISINNRNSNVTSTRFDDGDNDVRQCTGRKHTIQPTHLRTISGGIKTLAQNVNGIFQFITIELCDKDSKDRPTLCHDRDRVAGPGEFFACRQKNLEITLTTIDENNVTKQHDFFYPVKCYCGKIRRKSRKLD